MNSGEQRLWGRYRLADHGEDEQWFYGIDQCQCLNNCAPTPPLTQQQSTDNKLGLMLG